MAVASTRGRVARWSLCLLSVLALCGVAISALHTRKHATSAPIAQSQSVSRERSTSAPSRPASGQLSAPSTPVVGAASAAFATEPGIAGSILDATGGALIGALITARTPGSSGAPVASALSDDEGRFIVRVPAGRWLLSATAEAYSTNTRYVSAPARGQIMVMVPASAIAGYVVHERTSAAVAGVTVAAVGADGVQSLPVTTTSSQDGHFLFEGVSAGHYVLEVRTRSYRSAPTEVDVEVGTTTPPVQLKVSEATWLQADVSLASGRCSGGLVELEGGVPLLAPITDTGDVLIEAIPAGHYRATVRCQRGKPLSEELEVGAEPVERHWRIDSGLSVYGVVKEANGSALAGASVACDLARDQPVSAPARASCSCVSDAQGRFECDGLIEAEFTCRLRSEVSPSLAAANVSVRSGQRSTIVLHAPARGMIRMLPAEPDESFDVPLQGFAVRAADRSEFQAIRRGPALELPGLPLGMYSLYLAPPDLGGQAAATVALTRDSEVAEVRVTLPKASSLSGRVVDERDMPVPDAWVTAKDDANPGAATPPVLSGDQGQFVIPGVWPGRFSVEATSPFGVASSHGLESGASEVLLRLERLGSVSGSVQTMAGDAVPVFDVGYIREGTSGGRARGHDGRFSLPDLKPGRYALNVSSSAGEALLQDVVVAAGQTVRLNLTVSAGAMGFADISAFGEFHASSRE